MAHMKSNLFTGSQGSVIGGLLLACMIHAQAQPDPQVYKLNRIAWSFERSSPGWPTNKIVAEGKRISIPNPSGLGVANVTLDLPDLIQTDQPFTSLFSLNAMNCYSPWDVRIIGWGSSLAPLDDMIYGETNPVNIAMSGTWIPVYGEEFNSYTYDVFVKATPHFRDGTTDKLYHWMTKPVYPYFRFNFAANGGLQLSAWIVYDLQPPPPDQPQIDQKYAARETSIRVTVRGQNFGADAVPAFLTTNGVEDANLVVSNPTVVSASQLDADLFVMPDAALGPRILRVRTGGQDYFKTNALDVIGISFELNQAAKTSLAADRVANHPTVVRAQVDNSRRIQAVSGWLYVFKGNQQVSGSPFYPQVPNGRYDENYHALANDFSVVKTNYTAEDRFYLRNTVNFHFGRNLNYTENPALPAGDYNFIFVTSPKDPSSLPSKLTGLTKDALKARKDMIVYEETLPQNFLATKPMRILVLPDYRVGRRIADRLLTHMQLTESYLKAAYPVDGTQLRLTVDRSFNQQVIDIDALKPYSYNPFGHWWANLHAKLVSCLEARNRLASPENQYDRIALVVAEMSTMKALAEEDGVLGITDIASGAMISVDNMTTFAHESGHAYRLGDTYPGGWNTSVNPRRADALPDGNRVEEGAVRLFPLYSSKQKPLISVTASVAANGSPPPFWGLSTPYQRVSLMGASNDDNVRWFDYREWDFLFRLFKQQPAPTLPGFITPAALADFITVGGVIDIADTISLVEVVRDPNGARWMPTVPGDLTLELRTAAGAVLSSQSFGVDFDGPARGITTETAFRVSTPMVPDVAEVRLRKGTKVLLTRPVSAHAPTVTVLTPTAAQNVTGPVTLTWSASDTDGDTLTYAVYYLHNGADPSLIARDVKTTSLLWDPAIVAGGNQARIAVVASDGVNEGQGLSPAFTVPTKGPVVSIFSPASGVSVPSNQTITFTGGGFDPEDGYLPSTALEFRSNLDGNFSTGDTVNRSLSQGVHTITLSGTDKDGNVGEASITLTVGGWNQVPVISTLEPTSGVFGSTVTITGINLETTNTVVLFGTNAASISSLSATQCMVQIPAGLPPATVDVCVVAQGFTSEAAQFMVIAGHPWITSVQPRSGAPGTPVVLHVAELDPSTNVIVRFGGTVASILNIEGSSLLVAVPSGLAPGQVDLTVANPQGTSDAQPFEVMSGTPTSVVAINSLTPTQGSSGTKVTIQGKGFSTVLNNNRVDFGGTSATPLSITPNALEVTVPEGLNPGSMQTMVWVNGYPSNPLLFEALPTQASPLLTISRSNQTVVVSWPESFPNYRLQTTPVLPATNWTTISLSGTNRTSNPATNSTRYYRLIKP
jgi:hypothetical protein